MSKDVAIANAIIVLIFNVYWLFKSDDFKEYFDAYYNAGYFSVLVWLYLGWGVYCFYIWI